MKLINCLVLAGAVKSAVVGPPTGGVFPHIHGAEYVPESNDDDFGDIDLNFGPGIGGLLIHRRDSRKSFVGRPGNPDRESDDWISKIIEAKTVREINAQRLEAKIGADNAKAEKIDQMANLAIHRLQEKGRLPSLVGNKPGRTRESRNSMTESPLSKKLPPINT